MGCFESKQTKDTQDEAKGSSADEGKIYSWDKREKVDPALYTIDKAIADEVGRLPGSIHGQQFIVQNCENSQIFLFDQMNVLTVDDCKGCSIFAGPTKGSIFLRNCTECTVMAACGQFRARDCRKVDVLLHCQTQPIIEASTKMRFSCFQANYDDLEEHFEKAGLSIFNNNWSNVYDFTPVDGETNWSVIPKSVSTDQLFDGPKLEYFKSVNFTINSEASLVPYTRGSPVHREDEAVLMIVFYHEKRKATTKKVIDQMKKKQVMSSLQFTQEIKMEANDIQRIFKTDKFKEQAEHGPVIALMFVGNGIQEVSTQVSSDCNGDIPPSPVYSTAEGNPGHQSIDVFLQFAAMTSTF